MNLWRGHAESVRRTGADVRRVRLDRGVVRRRPHVASRLDDRGLPGARIVLVLVVLSACFVGYAVYTSVPRRRRARAVSRAARSMGAPYQSHFAPPSTMHALPFVAMVPADNRSLFEGFECALDGRRISVFTRSQAPDMYEPTIWRSCAATTSCDGRAHAPDRTARAGHRHRPSAGGAHVRIGVVQRNVARASQRRSVRGGARRSTHDGVAPGSRSPRCVRDRWRVGDGGAGGR